MIQRLYDRIDTENSKFGYIHYIPEYSNSIISDCNQLEFKTLYSCIIIQLWEYGIDFSPVKNLDKLKSHLENRPSDNEIEKLSEWKLFVNGFFGIIYRTDAELANLISGYAHQVLIELFNHNSNIIYMDTDAIYYTGGINMLDIDLPYRINKLKYFFITGKKKIIRMLDDGEIQIRGFHKHDKKNIEIAGKEFSPNDIVATMKAKNRDEQIDNILNN